MPIRLELRSYSWIYSNVNPTADPKISWLKLLIWRASLSQVPTLTSIGLATPGGVRTVFHLKVVLTSFINTYWKVRLDEKDTYNHIHLDLVGSLSSKRKSEFECRPLSFLANDINLTSTFLDQFFANVKTQTTNNLAFGSRIWKRCINFKNAIDKLSRNAKCDFVTNRQPAYNKTSGQKLLNITLVDAGPRPIFDSPTRGAKTLTKKNNKPIRQIRTVLLWLLWRDWRKRMTRVTYPQSRVNCRQVKSISCINTAFDPA